MSEGNCQCTVAVAPCDAAEPCPSLYEAWDKVRAEARALAGASTGIGELLLAVEAYGDVRACLARPTGVQGCTCKVCQSQKPEPHPPGPLYFQHIDGE